MSERVWMQKYDLHVQPKVWEPPVGWEDATIPSGELFPHYAYEAWTDEVDMLTGKKTGKRILWWNRASYFIPRQAFMMEMLQQDNKWKCIAIINGPIPYHAMNSIDGQAQVFRLRAV